MGPLSWAVTLFFLVWVAFDIGALSLYMATFLRTHGFIVDPTAIRAITPINQELHFWNQQQKSLKCQHPRICKKHRNPEAELQKRSSKDHAEAWKADFHGSPVIRTVTTCSMHAMQAPTEQIWAQIQGMSCEPLTWALAFWKKGSGLWVPMLKVADYGASMDVERFQMSSLGY